MLILLLLVKDASHVIPPTRAVSLAPAARPRAATYGSKSHACAPGRSSGIRGIQKQSHVPFRSVRKNMKSHRAVRRARSLPGDEQIWDRLPVNYCSAVSGGWDGLPNEYQQTHHMLFIHLDLAHELHIPTRLVCLNVRTLQSVSRPRPDAPRKQTPQNTIA
jgi:hypothetical protein